MVFTGKCELGEFLFGKSDIICVHILYTHIYTHIHTYVYTHTHTHTHVYTLSYIHTHTHTHTHTRIHTYVHMYYEHLIWTSLYDYRYWEIFMDETYVFVCIVTYKSKELISKVYKVIMHDQLCSGTSKSM